MGKKIGQGIREPSTPLPRLLGGEVKNTTIEWTNMTWDVIEGCKHNCPYCYVRRFKKDMTPRFYPERLREPEKVKTPKKIFVVNKGDLFGNWMPNEWIEAILEIIKRCPWHTFQLLTKNPAKMLEFDLPKNTWAGASVTKQEDCLRINIIRIAENPKVKYISFEPILGFIDPDLTGIDWVIIGAETEKNSYTPKNKELSQKFARPLIEKVLNLKIPLFLKENLKWNQKIQQYPKP